MERLNDPTFRMLRVPHPVRFQTPHRFPGQVAYDHD